MFETILIAVEGADQAADLLRAAMAITDPRRSEVCVVNVLRTPVAYGDRPASGLAGTTAAAMVDDAARILRQSGYRANGIVRVLADGGVADELVRIIDEVAPELVVMGSRGLSDLAAPVTASVSHRVLAQAGCPVLIAREGARIDPPRRLLLAYDESHHSRRAARVASDLAKATGAEIDVVTVHQPLLTWPGVVIDSSVDAQQRVDEIVAKLCEEVVAKGCVKVSARGRAAAIVQAADECDSHLVVMGARGLSRIAGAVIGSVSHEVIHLTTRQVLLVP
jgi:nucleotide-binding universal stress UspA family protein